MGPGEFEFERFTEVGKSFTARATIRQNGQIGFNEGARNQFTLSSFSHVVLYFDRKKRVIGMQFTNDQNEPGAIPFRNDTKNTFIPATSFLERFEISYERSRRFNLRRHGEMVYLELDHPLPSTAGDDVPSKYQTTGGGDD